MMPIFSRRFSQPVFVLTLFLTLTMSGVAYAAAESPPTPVSQVELPVDEAALVEQLSWLKKLIELYSPRDASLEQLYLGAIKGMLEATGDPYAEYLTAEQYAGLSQSIEGEYVGIGVTITLTGGIVTVTDIFSDSPAAKAGVLVGDRVVTVDGQDVRGKSLNEVSQLLRGQEGTSVSVTFERPSANRSFEAVLVRSMIVQKALEVKDLGDGVKYVRIERFSSTVGRDFSAIMDYFRSAGVKGIVLDLRGNPGGYLSSCLEIARELVPKGQIVEMRRREILQVLSNEEDTEVVPVAVLTDQQSASAAEILAGAIKDRGIGILVGDRTYGKAQVQTYFNFGDDGGKIKMTIADYYTPSGYLLTGKGLQPDVAVTQEAPIRPQEIEYEKPLKRGSVALAVLAIQANLDYLGYEVGEPDGVFGAATESALVSLLQDQQEEWDGTFDEPDLKAIEDSVQKKISDFPDTVLDRATTLLKWKLETGHWAL